MKWYIAQAAPRQKQRESNAEKFFLSDAGTDRAEDLVREGIQNALDAHTNSPVIVRIKFGTIPEAAAAKYTAGLQHHLAALSPLVPGLKAISGSCAFLTFEDFNTKGLTGDEKKERRYDDDPANAFHTFFRAEGKTDKTHGELGSHGIGKVAIMAASQARIVLGLTNRFDDARTLLFGTAVFRSHRIGNQDYECDAWFGIDTDEGMLPSEDVETLEQFRIDFGLTRGAGEPGFSIVIPWLDDDSEGGITAVCVINAILRGHAYPILRGDLAVEVIDATGNKTLIDAHSFLDVLTSIPDEPFKVELTKMAELTTWALANPPKVSLGEHGPYAPHWTDPNMATTEQRNALRERFDAGERLALRVPLSIRLQSGEALQSSFDIYLMREEASSVRVPTVQFLRRNLLISGMSKTVVGVRALIMATDGDLAGFLREAENPSHTRWDDKALKTTYRYAKGTLSFVLNSAAGIARLLNGDPAEKDKRIWADDLSLPSGVDPGKDSGSGSGRKTGKGGGGGGGGGGDLKRPYLIRTINSGFVVHPSGKPFVSLPALLDLQLAYHVRGHDPLKRWSKEDFDFSSGKSQGIKFSNTGCSIARREGKQLVLRISRPDFEFRVIGFDTHRELFCKPRLLRPDAPACDVETDADDDALLEAANEA